MNAEKQRKLLLPARFFDTGGRNFVWTPDLRVQLRQAMYSIAPDSLGELFRADGVMYLLPPGSPERFVTFTPIFRRGCERGEYIFGKQRSVFFSGWNDLDAVDAAVEWLIQKRKEEIDGWLDSIRPGNIPVDHQLTILDNGFLYKNKDARYYLSPPVFRQFLTRMDEAAMTKGEKVAA